MISEKKFIELLNLYLDHEISADEVRVLEAEILRSPARHTLYRHYCAMHKGCLELASRFAPESELSAAISAPAARKFARNREAPSTSRDKFGWGAWLGGLGLAAACGALVFFVFSHKHRDRGGMNTFAPAPALLAAPLANPLSIPTPSPIASAPHFRAHAGEGRAFLADGRDRANLAKHAFVTAAESVSTPSAEPLHAVYSSEFPHSHSAAPFHFSAIYTAGPTEIEREHLNWGPLVDLREMMENENETMPPTFQVRPAVAPSPRVYRRQERRFEGGRVEMTRFQFQR